MDMNVKYVVHALHDMAGAVWFGGNLFGIVALNSGVRAAQDHAERGAVLNQSWENFAPLSVASALVFGTTWAGIRMMDPRLASKQSRVVARTRDWLTVAAIANTMVSGVLNRQIAESAPKDRVPVTGGTEPAPETPEPAATAQGAMRYVAAANLLIGGTLIGTGSVLEQQVMDLDMRRNKFLPFNGRIPAFEALKTAAAIEMLRLGSKALGERIGIVKLHKPSRIERLTKGARSAWQNGRERVMAMAS